MRTSRLALASIALALAGCGGALQAASPNVTGSPHDSAATPTSSVSGPPSTATPAASAFPTTPTDVQGSWRAELGPGDVAFLRLTPTSYTITRLGQGHGLLRLAGDELVFWGSSLCEGDGTYRWSLTDGSLHLEMIGTDDCQGRSDALAGRTYARSG